MGIRADRIKEELRLLQGNSEMLAPAKIVEWAKGNPESQLHKCFEWDDSRAAYQYRVDQARNLIRLYITVEPGRRDTVSLRQDRHEDGGYRRIGDVMRIPDLKQQMLDEALADLRRIQKKYEMLTELASVWREIDALQPPEEKAAA